MIPSTEAIAAKYLAKIEKVLETDGPPFDKWERGKVLYAIQSAIEEAITQDRRGTCHLCKLPFTNLTEHYVAAHPDAQPQRSEECTCDNAAGLHWGRCPFNVKGQPRPKGAASSERNPSTQDGMNFAPSAIDRGYPARSGAASSEPQEWTPERVNVALLHERQLLAAEREKVEGLERANRGLYIESNERYQKLAAAVETLKRMPDLAYEVIIEHTGSVDDLPNELQCICDAALAEIKETK